VEAAGAAEECPVGKRICRTEVRAAAGVSGATASRHSIGLVSNIMRHRSRIGWLSLLLCVATPAFGETPTRIRVAHLVSKVDPVYPPAAKRAGIQGVVRLDAVIGKDGRVVNVKLISGNRFLGGAAKQAVMKWIYTPTLLNAQPIEVVMEVDVPFILPQKINR
jgi:TonB family protein